MAKVILLVEDSPDDELFFRSVLEQNKIANPIHVVRTGAQAIAYLGGEGKFADRSVHLAPNILFLDLRLPEMDGFEVLEWLQQRPDLKKHLLVVVLTQFGDANQIRRAYAMGADSFLPKPFTLADSENLIRHFGGYWLHNAEPPHMD